MKKKIHLFFRKPSKKVHYSVENFYKEIFKDLKDENLEIKTKVCPLSSKGIFNRIYLIFWAFFNQGDINHITGDINFISLFLQKKKTINTILDLYSVERLTGLKKFLYKIFWIRLPISKSSLIIAISKKIKNDLKNYLPKKKKIEVIDICTSSNFRKKSKKFGKIPKILLIGTRANKNLERVIKSLEKQKLKLIIIGELSIYQKNLLSNNKIDYKNYVGINNNYLIKQYFKSDILVFVSTYEGFGVPIIEAQKIGRAVITSNLYPMKYVAGNGALLVNPKSVKSIKSGILKIINNSRLRDNLINNGYKNVNRFKRDNIKKKYIENYKSILKIQ